MRPNSRNGMQLGFSLIELVLALLVTAIVLGGLLLWFTRPLEALVAAHASAGAADTAERALARFAADVANALPNSVRVACAGRCLELLSVVDAADYRAETPGNPLAFGGVDDTFDVLMPLASAPAAGSHVVINNLDASAGGSTSAYSADAASNRATVAAGTTSAQIRIQPKQFPAPSPTQRFYVVGGPVSYMCAPSATGGTLRRLAGYAIQAAQPTGTTLGDGLAEDVVACRFDAVDPRLVSVELSVGASASDAVQLFAQTRVVGDP